MSVVGGDDDLEGLDERELLELVVREQRALRRLVGAAFVVGVALAALAGLLAGLG